MRQQLKEDVSSFLTKSHELLYNIVKNLIETTNFLSSGKSRTAENSSKYFWIIISFEQYIFEYAIFF